MRKIEQGGRRRAEPSDFAREKRPVVALALPLAKEFAPIVARDLADPLRNGREPILLVIEVAIGFQPFVAPGLNPRRRRAGSR